MDAASDTARRLREALRSDREDRFKGLAEEDVTADYSLGRTPPPSDSGARLPPHGVDEANRTRRKVPSDC